MLFFFPFFYIQLWDLNTALEMYQTSDGEESHTCSIFILLFRIIELTIFFLVLAEPVQGPTKQELLHLLKSCDLTSAGGPSNNISFISSRTPSPSPSLLSIMYPGYKQTSVVSRIGTPISTPIMQHTGTGTGTGLNQSLEPSYYTDLPQPTSMRLSGLFTGSNLSLNGVNETIDVSLSGGTSGPPRLDEEVQIKEKTKILVLETTKDQVSDDDDNDIPDRPFSSSDVLDCHTDFTNVEPLRRVCSDTTPPITRKSKHRKQKQHRQELEGHGIAPLVRSAQNGGEAGSSNNESRTSVRESTLI